MDYNSLRNVASRQIYESYMGILRISPDSNYNDDMTTTLLTPPLTIDDDGNNIIGSSSSIFVSDSDGNEIGGLWRFMPRAKMTLVDNEDGTESYYGAVVFVSTYCESIFAKETLNIRNTLILNGINDNNKTLASLRAYYDSKSMQSSVYYPLESPNDANYFNNKRCMLSEEVYDGTSINSSTMSRYDAVNEYLYNQTPEWYTENFQDKTDEYVYVSNNIVTYKNVNNKAIPVVRTRDYVLGHYNGHSANVNRSDLGSTETNNISWFNDDTGTSTDKFTKLSWLDIDKIVWDEIDGIVNGNARHYDGRYVSQGTDGYSIIPTIYGSDTYEHNKSIMRYENDYNMRNVAPILGVSVQPGLIVYNAMPLRRFLFHTARQELLNVTEPYTITVESGSITSTEVVRVGGESTLSFSRKTGNFLDSSGNIIINDSGPNITPIERYAPGFVNNLAKNYILCTGAEINYKNYPNINLYNQNLFKRDDTVTSIKLTKSTDGLYYPEFVDYTSVSNNNDTSVNYKIYNAIKQSAKSFKTPELYKFLNFAGSDSDTGKYYLSTRYLRGLNWEITAEGGGDPTSTWNSYAATNGDMIDNTKSIMLVDNIPYEWMNANGGEADGYVKNINAVGTYGQNYAFAERSKSHRHYMFGQTESTNKTSYCSIIQYGKAGVGNGSSYNRPFSNRLEYFYRAMPFFSTSSNCLSGKSSLGTLTSWEKYSFGSSEQNSPYSLSWNPGHYYNPVKTAGRYLLGPRTLGSFSSFQEYLTALQNFVKNSSTTLYINNGLGDKIDKNSSGLDIYYKLRKMDEADGRMPFAPVGGAFYDGIQGYHVSRIHYHMSRRRKIVVYTDNSINGYGNVPPRGYGYTLKNSTYTDKTPESNGEIARCISSLPFESIDTLGQIDTDGQRNDITDDTGATSITTINATPIAPSINLLPLIRI